MNKRGVELLGKNIVSVIVAVIGIIIIITIIATVLKTYLQDTSLEKAASTVEYVVREAQEIRPGESKIITLTLSLDWFLVCFDENENINEKGFEKPSTMFGKKALCACKNKKCNEKACKEIDLLFKKDNKPLFMKIEIVDLNITEKSDCYEVQVLKVD
ncbi:MAG: hypothetical protein QXI41_00035 [Candidatus Pacearchaeota archaeon]